MTRVPAAALLRSAQLLCAATSVGEAADLLADTARELVGADGSHVFLLEEDGAQHTVNASGTDTHRGALHVDPGDRSVVARCLELGTLFVPDTSSSELVNPELAERFGATTLLAVPLGTVGGVVLWWRERRPAPRRSAVAAVESVAAQAAAVLARLTDLEVLRGQTLTDPLTGLANRRALVGRLEALTADGTVVLVDLDHFKRLNDEHGHRYGDQVLCQFADLLAPLAGTVGCVARYGGEEFALVLPGTRPVDVAAALQVVRATWALQAGTPTFSAGIAPHRPGGLPSEALEAADRALYEAKRSGRDRDVLSPETAWAPAPVAVHSLTLPLPRASSSGDPLPLELLDESLDRGLLVVHYQPVVAVQTGEVVALEALARLLHPRTGELLVPAQFLPLAERTGRVARLDDLVAEQAIASCAAWRRAHPTRAISVGLNVSVSDLDDAGLAARLLARCADRGLPADALVVEVTETLASQRGRGHEQALQELAAAGVNVTLDDFGTGFASLDYLLRFPVAGVKIDRSFTWALADPRGREVVRAVVDLGRQLGLHVVAEGVETPEQLAFLREIGCPFVQGYLLGRPVPASAVPALLDASAPAQLVARG